MFLVSDLGKAVAFYHDTLELPCEIYSEEYQWAEFDCGNVTLSLKGNSVQQAGKAAGRIALAVEDIFAACEELKEKGILIEKEPVDNGVCWHLEVLDPDGNLIILHRRNDGSFGQN